MKPSQNRKSRRRRSLCRLPFQAVLWLTVACAACLCLQARAEASAPVIEECEIDGVVWRIDDLSDVDSLADAGWTTMRRPELLRGGLLLVNRQHPLPSDFSDADLVGVEQAGIQAQDEHVRLFPEALEALSLLLGDAETLGEGFGDYIVREGYRTMAYQTELYQSMRQKLSDRYDGDELTGQVEKLVMVPGTSEYQSGLAFRLDLYNAADPVTEAFMETEQGRWVSEHGWEYGVVPRFPTGANPSDPWSDKSGRTGVEIQMNLYRYVGRAHAAVMRVMDFCLEEYVDFLKEHDYVRVYKNGVLKYAVLRVANDLGEQSFSFPTLSGAASYQASLDNDGGLVAAFTFE